MSLLLLKKKIQEKIDIIGNPSFGSENYHVKESYARVLRWIEELEKEEPSQYHECDHDGPFLLRGWSGRSEAEIRERIISFGKWMTRYHEGNTFDEDFMNKAYEEWVLSSSEKKDHVHDWVQGRIQPFRRQGTYAYYCGNDGCDEHVKLETVSSAPKQKKKHVWIGDGSREHVLYWDTAGEHCMDKDCELAEEEVSHVEKCGHQKYGTTCVLPKDHLGETEHSDKKVYWSDSSPKEKCEEVPPFGEMENCSLEKGHSGKHYSAKLKEVSREEKPIGPITVVGDMGDLFERELKKAGMLVLVLNDTAYGLRLMNGENLYSLEEVADLMEKIQSYFKKLEKEMGTEAFVEMVLKEYEGILHLWECDKSPGYYWPSDINWSRLFREKQDLVERIRKGGN